MIIAIDGPSGAGKGTLAKNLAQVLGMAYLDTGLLFRALAFKAKHLQIPLKNEHPLTQLAETLTPPDWQQDGLRAPEIAEAASLLATFESVRKAFEKLMQSFAHFHETQGKGAILDGRDIGTVICPYAQVKLYITASPAKRAQRRFQELQLNGFTGTLGEVLSDIERRDQRDQSRALAPLKPAEDAIIIDTTSLSPRDVLNIALNYISKSYPDKVDLSRSGV